ncbi:MAG TPA: hypothetical protein VGE52_01390 [Pirellulales bacterium]
MTLRAALCFAALAFMAPALSAATPAGASGPSGTTSKSAKQEAVDSLPLGKLNAANRAKVEHVLEDAAMYRQLPVSMCRCEPQLYLLLVNRPDTVVNIWEVLGISQFDLRQIGPNLYQADDGTGMQTTVEFLHRSHDAHIAYVEGLYQGPLLSRKIKAQCVLFLRSQYAPAEDGSWMITHRLDAFVRFDALGAEMLARTMNSMIGKIADRNFREVSNFITNLSTRAVDDAEWTADLASKLDNVRPDVRDQFAKVTAAMANRSPVEQTAAVAPPAEETGATAIDARRTARPHDLFAAPSGTAAEEGALPAEIARRPAPVSASVPHPIAAASAPAEPEEELDWETEKAPIARPVASRMSGVAAPVSTEIAPLPEAAAPVRVDHSARTMQTTPIKPAPSRTGAITRPNRSSNAVAAPVASPAASEVEAAGESVVGPAFPE